MRVGSPDYPRLLSRTRINYRTLKVSFHPEHVRKILKQRLRWTSQKPEKRAKARGEEAIRH